MKILETERLILRTWEDSDLQKMFEINQDPQVMEYFPSLQDLKTTKKLVERINNHFDKYGYTVYACERKDTSEFIGFIGLFTPEFDAQFTPATEIGWRLSSKHWGLGFATEGAKAVLNYAFNDLKIPEIVSFTAMNNLKSINVMKKIGLHHNKKDDFDHPKLDVSSNLRRHVLYRLRYNEFINILQK